MWGGKNSQRYWKHRKPYFSITSTEDWMIAVWGEVIQCSCFCFFFFIHFRNPCWVFLKPFFHLWRRSSSFSSHTLYCHHAFHPYSFTLKHISGGYDLVSMLVLLLSWTESSHQWLGCWLVLTTVYCAAPAYLLVLPLNPFLSDASYMCVHVIAEAYTNYINLYSFFLSMIKIIKITCQTRNSIYLYIIMLPLSCFYLGVGREKLLVHLNFSRKLTFIYLVNTFHITDTPMPKFLWYLTIVTCYSWRRRGLK